MEKRIFGKTGLEVSILGFGGAEVGFSKASVGRVRELLDSALDAGLNVIDTAECYMASEELLGEAVSGRRKNFYLFSKCGHSRGYEHPDWDDIPRMEESLDLSLTRLRTDYLDLFQIHSCPKDILERGDILDFMERAKRSGKTRFIGYSGDNEAALFAVQSGRFDTLQTSINIAEQRTIDTVLPEAVKQNMGVIAKRPVANAAWRHKTRPPDDFYGVTYWDRLQKLDYDFLKKDMGESVADALRFTLAVPGVTVAIVGTQQPGRWQENACLLARGPLDPREFTAIRERWKQRAEKDWEGEI